MSESGWENSADAEDDIAGQRSRDKLAKDVRDGERDATAKSPGSESAKRVLPDVQLADDSALEKPQGAKDTNGRKTVVRLDKNNQATDKDSDVASIITSETDQKGRPVCIKRYDSKEDADHEHASAASTFTYSETADGKHQTRIETYEDGPDKLPRRTEVITKSADSKTGTTTVDVKPAVTESDVPIAIHAVFDGSGQAVELTKREGDFIFKAQFKDGSIAAVEQFDLNGNKIETPAEAQDTLKTHMAFCLQKAGIAGSEKLASPPDERDITDERAKPEQAKVPDKSPGRFEGTLVYKGEHGEDRLLPSEETSKTPPITCEVNDNGQVSRVAYPDGSARELKWQPDDSGQPSQIVEIGKDGKRVEWNRTKDLHAGKFNWVSTSPEHPDPRIGRFDMSMGGRFFEFDAGSQKWKDKAPFNLEAKQETAKDPRLVLRRSADDSVPTALSAIRYPRNGERIIDRDANNQIWHVKGPDGAQMWRKTAPDEKGMSDWVTNDSPPRTWKGEIRATKSGESQEIGGDGSVKSWDRVGKTYDSNVKVTTVKDGVIYDADGKQLGKMAADGTVTLAGASARTFKVGESEGAQFHGVAGDGKSIDIASPTERNGLNGTFTSPDGKTTYAVVNDKILDKDGKHFGTIDRHGQIQLATEAQHAASAFRDWRFAGSEGGKKRVMDLSGEIADGKLFLPDASGHNKEYVVRSGMIIDKQTDEQVGLLKAPIATADGKFTGGSITWTQPAEDLPAGLPEHLKEGPGGSRSVLLRDFTLAVFDLHTPAHSEGVPGRQIRGACLGPGNQLDGTKHADGSEANSGMLDFTAAENAEAHRKRVADERWKSKTEGFINRYMNALDLNSGTYQVEKERHEQELAAANSNLNRIRELLSKGEIDRPELEQLGIKTAVLKDVSNSDKLVAERRRLDRMEPDLEKGVLDQPEKVNGHMVVQMPDGTGKVREVDCPIRNGVVFNTGADNKEYAVAKLGAGGELLDADTGKPTGRHMKDEPGVLWQLSDGAGHDVRWVALGKDMGMASLGARRGIAEGELAYARRWQTENPTETNIGAAAETESKAQAYELRLAEIGEHGVRTGEDLAFLLKAPKDEVRAEAHREHLQHTARPADVPALSAENIQTVNGKLRISSDIYEIREGALHRVSFADGKEQTDANPCGRLGPGYQVDFQDGRHINLAREDRVLMKFKYQGSECDYLVVGLGPGQTKDDGTFVPGGLVAPDRMLAEAQRSVAEAQAGNQQYFAERPWVTGAIANWTMGDRETLLREFGTTMVKERDQLAKDLDKMFATGFKASALSNNELDHFNHDTQQAMKSVGWRGRNSVELAQDGMAMQKLVNDSFVMAATTVGTAGVGTILGAVVNGTKISAVTYAALEVGSGAMMGGTFRALGALSDASDDLANFKSGMIEGGLMSGGSAAARMVGDIGKLDKIRQAVQSAKPGVQLAGEKAAMANSLIGKMVKAGYSDTAIQAAVRSYQLGESTVQAGGFAYAGMVREGKGFADMSVKETAQGGLIMFATNLFGRGITHGLEKAGIAEGSVATRVVSDTTSSFANSAASSMHAAYETERARIARDFELSDPNLVSDEMLRKYAKSENIAREVATSGYMGAVTAPIMSIASHHVVKLVEGRLAHRRTAIYDLFKDGNPEPHFASPKAFKELEGTQAYRDLQQRHELERIKIATRAMEDIVPLREKTATIELAKALLAPGGLKNVEKHLEIVPERLWTENGKQLTREEMLVKVQKAADAIATKSNELEFNRITAKEMLDRMVQERQTAPKDAAVMQQIETEIKQGRIPTRITVVEDPQTGEIKYTVNEHDWRPITAEERQLSVKESTEFAQKVARDLDFLTDVPLQGDQWESARQFTDYDLDSPKVPRSMDRVIGTDLGAKPTDRYLVGAGVQFRIEKENAILLNEIATQQRAGKFPVAIREIEPKGADKIPRYEIKEWRDATAEERTLPLTEIVKNYNLVDYGFGDRGKVSLGAHDGFDHMFLFEALREEGLLGKDANGRGYADLLKQLGDPQSKNMFNRESEVFASIGYEWRSFHEMHRNYEPPVSMDQIAKILRTSGEPTANQKAAMEYITDLQRRDPEGKTPESRLLRHIVQSVEEELTEASRKYDRPWLENPNGTTTEKISTNNPEYISLIIDITREFKKNDCIGFVDNLNLLLESRLRLAADQHGEFRITPDDFRKPAPSTDNVPPEVREWLKRHPASPTRRAAIRDWPTASK